MVYFVLLERIKIGYWILSDFNSSSDNKIKTEMNYYPIFIQTLKISSQLQFVNERQKSFNCDLQLSDEMMWGRAGQATSEDKNDPRPLQPHPRDPHLVTSGLQTSARDHQDWRPLRRDRHGPRNCFQVSTTWFIQATKQCPVKSLLALLRFILRHQASFISHKTAQL